jgi:ribosomal protein S18 acetylase RimI-like enzyme
VIPEYRGKAVGEALLAETAKSLRRRDFTLLSLTVTQANDRAVALYERLGFGTTRIFDAFVWEG